MYSHKKELRSLSPYFHIHVSVSVCDVSHDQSTYFPAAEYADRSWEYINRTPKHECMNWDCGRAVPFMGIYVSNFRCSIFAVWEKIENSLNSS
jgi:hypothetical protein